MELYAVWPPYSSSVVVHQGVYQTTQNQEQQLKPEEIGDQETNWLKNDPINMSGQERKRLKTRERVKKHRERKKMQLLNEHLDPKGHEGEHEQKELKRLKTRERVKKHRERKKKLLINESLDPKLQVGEHEHLHSFREKAAISPELEIRRKIKAMTVRERVQKYRQRKKLIKTLQLEGNVKMGENQPLYLHSRETLILPKSKPQHRLQQAMAVQQWSSRHRKQIQKHLTKALDLVSRSDKYIPLAASLQQPSNSNVTVKGEIQIDEVVPFGYEIMDADEELGKKIADSSLPNENELEASTDNVQQSLPQSFLDDNDDELKSLSVYAKNSTNDRDDFDTFGSFVASEIRGLRNDVSLIRKVKRKIQLAIIEAYETYNPSETACMYLPTTSKLSREQTSQPFHLDSVQIKKEHSEIDPVLTTMAAVKIENITDEEY